MEDKMTRMNKVPIRSAARPSNSLCNYSQESNETPECKTTLKILVILKKGVMSRMDWILKLNTLFLTLKLPNQKCNLKQFIF